MSKYILVFNKKTMRPGCINIQAAMGGSVPRHLFHEYFDSQFWEVSISPDMQRYTVTEEELPRISALMELTKDRIK